MGVSIYWYGLAWGFLFLLSRTLGGLRSLSGHGVEEKNLCSQWELNPDSGYSAYKLVRVVTLRVIDFVQ